MAKKVKLEHSVTQNGNAIAFVNTLTPEQLTKHESWLTGHGMTAQVASTLGGGSIETAGKLIVVPEGRTIALTFKDKRSAEAVFNEIFGEGALDADEWDDDTIYAGGQTEGLAESLGNVAKAAPRMEKAKAAKTKKKAAR